MRERYVPWHGHLTVDVLPQLAMITRCRYGTLLQATMLSPIIVILHTWKAWHGHRIASASFLEALMERRKFGMPPQEALSIPTVDTSLPTVALLFQIMHGSIVSIGPVMGLALSLAINLGLEVMS